MNTSPGTSLPGPDDITRMGYSNGITLLARSNFSSPSIVIGGYFSAGSLFDSDEKLGLADFTAAGLMRGTRKRDFQQIFNDLESIGASLSFSAGGHTAGFSGRCLVEDFPLLLELFSETLREPVFPPQPMEHLRAQFLTSLALRSQDTAEMASLTFDQLVYRDHPYARPDDGWPETIQAITLTDVEEFHHRQYGPAGMVIAVVGAMDPKAIADLLAARLGDWNNPVQQEIPQLPELRPLTKSVSKRIDIPGKSQADIVIGGSGPRRTDPEFLAVSLGNSVLGQFGMGGRIGLAVREKAGLAYYASTSLSAGIGPGTWDVSAGVNPANIRKASSLILNEISIFIDKGVKSEELADSQANFIGRMPLALESNAGVVNALLNIERYGLGLDYYLRYPDLVKSVQPVEVLDSARYFLPPDRLAVAIAGPMK
jgi:zinc protease